VEERALKLIKQGQAFRITFGGGGTHDCIPWDTAKNLFALADGDFIQFLLMDWLASENLSAYPPIPGKWRRILQRAP